MQYLKSGPAIAIKVQDDPHFLGRRAHERPFVKALLMLQNLKNDEFGTIFTNCDDSAVELVMINSDDSALVTTN